MSPGGQTKDTELKGCVGVLYFSKALASKERKPVSDAT
jgi:hypothetical protein